MSDRKTNRDAPRGVPTSNRCPSKEFEKFGLNLKNFFRQAKASAKPNDNPTNSAYRDCSQRKNVLESQDFHHPVDGFVGGEGVEVEPVDVVVALEPRQLFLGIDAGVLLDALDGHIQRPDAVKDVEEFFVADGVEGVEMAVGIEAADFVEQAVLHHGIHTLVDALEQVVATAIEPDFDDAERALLALACAEGGVGAACLVADFEGMDNALCVFRVNKGIILGVEQAEFLTEDVETFVFQTAADVLPYVVADGGDVVDAVADSVDIHHASTTHQLYGLGRKRFVEQFEHVGFVLGGAVVLVEVEGMNEIVAHFVQFLRSRCCGADAHATEHLARVGRDNRTRQTLSQT